DQPSDHQLAVAVQGGIGPNVPVSGALRPLLLGPYERPNLVRLDPLSLEPAHPPVLIARAELAHVNQQLQHGRFCPTGQPHSSTDAVPLAEGPDNSSAALK